MRQNPDLRFVGHGVEWDEALQDDILENLDQVSVVELIPENFFRGRRQEFLRKLGKTGIPVMVHGVELSIGSDEPLKTAHLDEMLRVADEVNLTNFSDHLCMTEMNGTEIGQLTPLPFTWEMADIVCRKVEQVQKRLDVPFLLENITNRFVYPHSEMTEPQFINAILRRTGAYLLLDLHNIHVNGSNFGYDPHQWLEEVDMDRVLGIHLAGGHRDDEGYLVDSHGAPVPEPVWELYRHVCRKVAPACTIVERTSEIPPYAELLAEIARSRAIFFEERAVSFDTTLIAQGSAL